MAEHGDLIWFLLIGLAAGWGAASIMKRSDMGVMGNMLVGVVGSILGVSLFQQLDIDMAGIFGNRQLGELAVSFAGAVLLLVLAGFLKPKKKD